MPPILTRCLNSLKHPDIRDLFRIIDWMSLAMFVLITLLQPTWPLWENRLPLPTWAIYFVLAGLFGLSWIFPVKRSLGYRRFYTALSVSLLMTAFLSGYSLDLLLYLLITKSCFLLTRRDLIIMVTAVGLIWTSAQIWLFQLSVSLINQQPQEILSSQRVLISTIFGSFSSYVVASTFVLLLSLTILREQRSRARAEQLTKEVEVLAATVERSRIAREIHDSLGHTLTALNVQIELAQRLQERDPGRSTQSIDIAQKLAAQCLQDVRHAVHSMNDRHIDLNTAIASLVAPMQTDADFQVMLMLKFPILPPTISHQIYCIVQEGLTNIQRHAVATKVKLKGEMVGNRIFVNLQDNGIGFLLDQANMGFGLCSMSERAQLLGGKLEIQSSPDTGTHIHLELPCP
jgi:signal transduction histidine kinase